MELRRFVESEKKYRKAVDFVLGNLLIVETYETAIQISKTNSFSGNIVTLAGELFPLGGESVEENRVREWLLNYWREKRKGRS
ncbi:chromosome segregation protein SMC [Fusobacterium necrophorum subsp. necrophorum]|nr:chromosome segregation protein SMC [Fusobacterium necrophorum subsp. necrophorum]